jgi:hypothetical protein
MSTGQFSYGALMVFMDWLTDKGLLARDTAASRKTAAQKVLETLDSSEKEDLREIDRDDVFFRFQNLNRSRYKPASLKVYRSRFNAALDDFFAHAKDPSGFKPTMGNSKKDGAGPKRAKQNAKRSTPAPATAPRESSNAVSVTENQLTLPIPLRPGLMVKIFGLPADLTEDEAKKLCAVVTAYAIQK